MAGFVEKDQQNNNQNSTGCPDSSSCFIVSNTQINIC